MKKKNMIKLIAICLKNDEDLICGFERLESRFEKLEKRIDAIERIKSWNTPVGDSEAGGKLADKMVKIKERAEGMREKITHIGLTAQSFADLDAYFFNYLGADHVSAESKIFGLDLVPANENYCQTDNDIQSRRTLL